RWICTKEVERLARQRPDINRFLTEASDLDHLATKVILVLGIYGATRADELTKLVLKDIEVQGA
ncbi:hypothetical protein Bhyg_12656, partial [Pseudolycoriella hygida]